MEKIEIDCYVHVMRTAVKKLNWRAVLKLSFAAVLILQPKTPTQRLRISLLIGEVTKKLCISNFPIVFEDHGVDSTGECDKSFH